MDDIKPYTTWRHHNGQTYNIHSIAEHVETGEKLVIYAPNPSGWYPPIYARPISDWKTEVEGQPRFVQVDSIPPGPASPPRPKKPIDC